MSRVHDPAAALVGAWLRADDKRHLVGQMICPVLSVFTAVLHCENKVLVSGEAVELMLLCGKSGPVMPQLGFFHSIWVFGYRVIFPKGQC